MSELPSLVPAIIAEQHQTQNSKDSLLSGLLVESITREQELKFLVSETQAEAIAGWAGSRMSRDPLTDGADSFRVRTLYFDTPRLDVYHRMPGFGGCFRARRYGNQAEIYLERKRKVKEAVRERRAGVLPEELARLAEDTAQSGWAGDWFHLGLLERGLRDCCRVSYSRHSFLGEALGAPFRLTIDRDGHCAPSAGLHLDDHGDGAPLLRERSILELRFGLAMPGTFKALLREFGLAPTRFSKYRMAVEACGLVEQAGTGRHAG